MGTKESKGKGDGGLWRSLAKEEKSANKESVHIATQATNKTPSRSLSKSPTRSPPVRRIAANE